MKSVGLKVLKNRLSEYVRLAAGGEVILVTDRDQVVAELVPPRETRSQVVSDALLADAVRQGWVVPPLVVSVEPPKSIPVHGIQQILTDLAADREDR